MCTISLNKNKFYQIFILFTIFLARMENGKTINPLSYLKDRYISV